MVVNHGGYDIYTFMSIMYIDNIKPKYTLKLL